MGPFVDATDGVTPETGVTLGAADQAEVLKENGAATVAMGGTFAAVTGADGWYDYTVATGDVDTVGEVVFVVQDASVCLPVFTRAYVVEESVYDSLFDAGSSDIADILGDTSTTLDTKLNDIQGATFNSSTDSLEAIRNRGDSAWTGSPTTSDSGTAQAGAAGSITLQSGASATDDTYNGQVVYISSGTGAGQSRAISDYVGSTKVASVITNWATAPDNTSVYEVYPDDITEITAAPTAAAVADAVWDESTSGHTTAGTFGEQVKNDIDAILVDTAELQSDWTDGGRLDLILDSILVDTGTTLDGKIDTIDSVVDSILVDTATLGAPAGADFAADIAAIKAETALIVADTNELQTDWADGGRLDLIVDAILDDTGTSGVAIAGTPSVNVTQISGNSAAADNLEASARAVITGTAQTGTLSTTVMTSDLTGYADDELIGRVVVWYSGTADGQSSDITDYASASGTITYTAINTAPANADLFVIV
jgi:hypothetical protein